jgi:hypothetical protein
MFSISVRVLALAMTASVLSQLLMPSVLAQPTGTLPPDQPKQEISLNKPFPVGKLGVSVTISPVAFNLGPTKHQAWLYKTSGMNRLKQPELFILILRNKDEPESAFPKQPIRLLAGLARPSEGSKSFDELDFIPMQSFLGKQFSGLGMVPFDNLTGVNAPKASLGCVTMTPEEFEVWQLAGPARTKAALANQVSYFPTPIWCDRTRTSVFSKADVEEMKQEHCVYLASTATRVHCSPAKSFPCAYHTTRLS